jgi:hypothetical protein
LEEEARIRAEEEARIKAEEEARIRAEEEARKKAEEEARIKAEEEARIKVEEEACIRAKEEARIRSEEEARIKVEEEARIRAKEEARIRSEEEARIKVEEEARIRAKEEARIRSEEEARIKAEEEARIKAEEEARIKAEEEARIRAQEEAHKKAEEEARIKAEEEARIKVKEEARIRAEEEAQIRAEEEARKKAEEEARKKTEEEVRIKTKEEARKKTEEQAKIKAEEDARKKAQEEIRKREEAIAKAKRKAEEEALIKKRKDEEITKKLALEEERKRQKEEAIRKKSEEKEHKRQAELVRKQKLKEEGKDQNKLIIFWTNNKISITAVAVILFGVLIYSIKSKDPKPSISIFPESGSATDSANWNITLNSDKIEDYQNYLNQFPDGIFKDVATQKIDSLVSAENFTKENDQWRKVLALNDTLAYEDYLDKYPKGRFISQAKKEIDRIKRSALAKTEVELWEIVKNVNTIEGYKDFIFKYPKSLKADEVKKIIFDLEYKIDKQAFDRVIQINSIPELEAFIKNNLTGSFVEEAKTKLKILSEEIEENKRQISMQEAFNKAGDNIEELTRLAGLYKDYSKINDIYNKIELLKKNRKVSEPPGVKPPDNAIIPDEKPLPYIIAQIEKAMVDIPGAQNVKTFKMLESEVTQQIWAQVMGSSPSRYKGCDQCPVEQVSYHEAIAFIEKLNEMQSKFKYALPSEAQWEYAASNKGRYNEYAGGTDISEVAVYLKNSKNGTSPVKSKKSNGLGLYDMSGNVYEWTSTSYSSKEMVIKGGSWKDPASSAEIRRKGSTTKDDKSSSIGFRIIRQ